MLSKRIKLQFTLASNDLVFAVMDSKGFTAVTDIHSHPFQSPQRFRAKNDNCQFNLWFTYMYFVSINAPAINLILDNWEFPIEMTPIVIILSIIMQNKFFIIIIEDCLLYKYVIYIIYIVIVFGFSLN